jgi:selenocysteine lyase/cysteine desulfurase
VQPERLTTADLTAPCAAAQFRRRFPVLQETVHLASCSLGARSTDLDAAIGRMLDAMEGGAAAWTEFDRETERCRQGFAALIGAEAEQVAILPNASIGAYQVISTLSLADRDGVVASSDEFPSIAHVWLAQRRRGARVRFVAPTPPAGHDAGYGAAIDDRTALVSVPLVTYSDGAVLPVAEVARLAHARGARVFVDAYQAAGVLPVNVTELDCDYLVAGAQKYLLGLPGVAFLYVRDGARMDLEPVLTGWFGRVDPYAFDPRRLDFHPSARRFETGTPAVPALYAANAGMGLLAGLDAYEVRRHVGALIDLTAERLSGSGEQLRPTAPHARAAHIALPDRDPVAFSDWLAAQGIRVSPRGSAIRLSFHYYNDETDVERLCEAVERYRAVGRPNAAPPALRPGTRVAPSPRRGPRSPVR